MKLYGRARTLKVHEKRLNNISNVNLIECVVIMYRWCKDIKKEQKKERILKKNMELYHFGTANRGKWYKSRENKLEMYEDFFDT